MTCLAESCLKRQSEFDDALGPEILFVFFDPDVSPRTMSEDAIAVRHRFQEGQPASFLFAGMGEAYPVPTGLLEIGRGKFRSERPGHAYFNKIACQAAASNSRAVPFFQQTFNLKPQQNYLLIAHRKQRTVQTFDLGENLSISSDGLLRLVRSLRPIARHLKGAVDLEAIKIVATAHVSHSAMRSAAQLVWNAIRPTIRSLPD